MEALDREGARVIPSITLADKDGNDVVLHDGLDPEAKRQVVRARGLYGISNIRQAIRSRPQAHGDIDDSRFTGGKLIALEMEIASHVSEADALSELRAVTEPILQTLDYGPALLKWTEAGGTALQRLVKVTDDFDPDVEPVGAIFAPLAQFLADDPRAYSQTLEHEIGDVLASSGGGLVMPFTFPFSFNESSGGGVTITLGGNRPTPPVLRIYGACTSPRVRHVATGHEIVLTGSISAGEYIEIGMDSRGQRYVRLNGSETANRANLIDFQSTTWFDLNPGVTTLQLLATTFDANAHLEVLARAAFA